jgi:hypothetical protein
MKAAKLRRFGEGYPSRPRYAKHRNGLPVAAIRPGSRIAQGLDRMERGIVQGLS